MNKKIKKLRFFKMMLVTVLFVGPVNGDVVYDRSLVAHYEFESRDSDSPCTYLGNAQIVADDERGNVLSLDGQGDYLNCGNEPVFNIQKEITIACWVKFNALAKDMQPIVCKGGQSWTLSGEGGTGSITFYCNNIRPTEHLFGKAKVSDRKWHHIAAVYDGSKMYLYVDGELDVAAESTGELEVHDDDPVWIGSDLTREDDLGWSDCFGFVDDVAIFKRSLGPEEVRRLYKQGLSSSIAGPMMQKFVDTVQNARAAVEKSEPLEAIIFLEKQIAGYEQWKAENPNAPVLRRKRMGSDLYYLLAKVKDSAGAPKQEVADAYSRAIESDKFSLLSLPRQGSALLWLFENTSPDEYQDIVCSLIANDSDYLTSVASRAEMMVHEQKSKAAVKFLEDNLVAYSRWQEKHPFHDVAAEDNLPEMYFQLAKAKESVGAAKKDVADAYSKVFCPSRRNYVPERTTALIWLIENECAEKCTEAIASFTQSRDVKGPFKKVVNRVSKHFESKADWTRFAWFLDLLFTRTKYPYEWLVVVESSLTKETAKWPKKYFEYLDSRPALKLGRDCKVAEKYMAEENFEEAAELYKDIVNRCVLEDDKAVFEFQLCRCLFQEGRYSEAGSQIESFIANNKATHRNLAKEALLMKGQTHIHLGELDEAVGCFFTLMMEYPEIKIVPKVNFFLGYCYMLQGKLKAALETFECLVRGYPNSAYADKARTFAKRIRSMI